MLASMKRLLDNLPEKESASSPGISPMGRLVDGDVAIPSSRSNSAVSSVTSRQTVSRSAANKPATSGHSSESGSSTISSPHNSDWSVRTTSSTAVEMEALHNDQSRIATKTTASSNLFRPLRPESITPTADNQNWTSNGVSAGDQSNLYFDSSAMVGNSPSVNHRSLSSYTSNSRQQSPSRVVARKADEGSRHQLPSRIIKKPMDSRHQSAAQVDQWMSQSVSELTQASSVASEAVVNSLAASRSQQHARSSAREPTSSRDPSPRINHTSGEGFRSRGDSSVVGTMTSTTTAVAGDGTKHPSDQNVASSWLHHSSSDLRMLTTKSNHTASSKSSGLGSEASQLSTKRAHPSERAIPTERSQPSSVNNLPATVSSRRAK